MTEGLGLATLSLRATTLSAAYRRGAVDPVDVVDEVLRRMRSREIPLAESLERTGGLLTGHGPLQIELAEFARLHSRSVGEQAVRLGAEKFGITVRVVKNDLPAPSPQQFATDDAQAQELLQELTDWVAAQKPADLQLQWSVFH